MPKSKLQLFTRALHIFITIFYSHTIDAPFPSVSAISRMNKYLSRIITWRTQIIKIFSIVISVGAIAIMSFIFFVSARCYFPNTTCPNKDVLGANIPESSKDLLMLENSRDFWKQTIAAHPDYEDGYIQLITLSYQLGNNNDVVLYIEELQKLNPNHRQLKTLMGLIEINRKE